MGQAQTLSDMRTLARNRLIYLWPPRAGACDDQATHTEGAVGALRQQHALAAGGGDAHEYSSVRRYVSFVELFGARHAVPDTVAAVWHGGLVASAQCFSNVAR
ncbi:hypothetical protein NX05_05425 [Xanthomonas vasicola]|nr:hypothetical protein NX05_05425 [Xanthomonas vasicola]